MREFTSAKLGLKDRFAGLNREQVRALFEELSPDVQASLREANRTYVSWPSSDPQQPSPHATGGSIDVWLYEDGQPVNLGVPFDWMEENAGAFYHMRLRRERFAGPDRRICERRERLILAMVRAGFTCYGPEIWHFNFGNQMDALVRGGSCHLLLYRAVIARRGRSLLLRGRPQPYLRKISSNKVSYSVSSIQFMLKNTPQKIQVAIICGGSSNERSVSLKSGAQVLKHLSSSEKYTPFLVEIKEDGDWVRLDTNKSIDVEVLHPGKQKLDFDVAFIALHGAFGEDGKIQALFELMGVPYTGSGILASALCMNKVQASKMVSLAGLSVPKSLTFQSVSNLSCQAIHQQIVEKIGYPCVIKPNQSGSSIGVSIVESEHALQLALDSAMKEDGSILVEECIKGREFTCGVMGNSSVGGELKALPVVEIISDQSFFDYQAKYLLNSTQEICPANLSKEATNDLQGLSIAAHSALQCDGVSRSDFILREGTFYFLETNTIPGLTEQSLCPKEAAVLGWSFASFLKKQLDLALEKIHT
jgi:D-alanine-D-alanine ligase